MTGVTCGILAAHRPLSLALATSRAHARRRIDAPPSREEAVPRAPDGAPEVRVMLSHNPRVVALVATLVVSIAIALGSVLPASALLGDIDLSGAVGAPDLDLIRASLGSGRYTTPTPVAQPWSTDVDLDQDNLVDVADLAIAGRSYGSTRNFHFARGFANGWYSSIGTRHGLAVDGLDRLHVAWSDGSGSGSMYGVFYTRLDRYGNTLVDDILLDTSSSSGMAHVNIAADAAGNAHILWDCHSAADLCYAQVSRFGQVVQRGTIDTNYSTANDSNIAVDSNGNAHVLYTRGSEYMVYRQFFADGTPALTFDFGRRADGYEEPLLAADRNGNVNLLWIESGPNPDEIIHARFGSGPTSTIGTRQLSAITSPFSPQVPLDATTDPNGSLYVIFADNRGDGSKAYVRKMAGDGTIAAADVALSGAMTGTGYGRTPQIESGPDGRLHVMMFPVFQGSTTHLGYGIYNQDLSVASPIRWMVYGDPPFREREVVDSQGDVHITYKGNQPNCQLALADSTSRMCYQSTAFDAASSDRTRTDLGVDAAHTIYQPVDAAGTPLPGTMARWGTSAPGGNRSLDVTATVFNAGWVDAPATTVTFTLKTQSGTVLTSGTAPVGALTRVCVQTGPSCTQTVTARLPLILPTPIPTELANATYLRLVVEVDPTHAVTETTEANNLIDVPVFVQPLPTTAGLYATVLDQTYMVRGGEEEPVEAGTAHIVGPGVSRDVALGSNHWVYVLGKDFPVNDAWTSYTVSWTGPATGTQYATTTPIVIQMRRNPTDPYVIDYSQPAPVSKTTNTVTLYTNRWGALTGTISGQGVGLLSGATVRIRGQDLSVPAATTNASGVFTSAELNKLIPGEYEVRVSRADYARIVETVTMPSLGAVSFNRTMAPTANAYVVGRVINQYDRSVVGATVTASGGPAGTQVATTDGDGFFSMEIDKARTTLAITKANYDPYSQALPALTAGLETDLGDIPVVSQSKLAVGSGGVISWLQDETSGDLLPTPPDDANWVEKKIFEQFSDKFWPEYRVTVWWGCYEYELSVLYTGGSGSYAINSVDVRLTPKTFEAHRVQGKGEVEISGRSIGVTIGVLGDSGILSVPRATQARVVNTISPRTPLYTQYQNTVGQGFWDALTSTTRTYNLGDTQVANLSSTEVWIYLKVGKNDGGFTSSPILSGYHLDTQVLKINLGTGAVTNDYVVDFPSY
jgi:hypothetical protein